MTAIKTLLFSTTANVREIRKTVKLKIFWWIFVSLCKLSWHDLVCSSLIGWQPQYCPLIGGILQCKICSLAITDVVWVRGLRCLKICKFWDAEELFTMKIWATVMSTQIVSKYAGWTVNGIKTYNAILEAYVNLVCTKSNLPLFLLLEIRSPNTYFYLYL